MNSNFRLFGMEGSKDFAKQVANHLDIEVSKHIEEYFADREPYLRSDVNVRGCDVYVIQSLYGDDKETVAEKFFKLLLFVGSLRDASAKRVSCVIPYLFCARQDRKTESRAPITTKYVAQMLEVVGMDRLLTMDVHNLSAFQNAYRVPTDNLEAKNLIADYVAEKVLNETIDLSKITILSPDSGGMGRAKRFRNSLSKRLDVDLGLAYLDKTHAGKVIQGHEIVGEVEGREIIVIDDMISSASTAVECDKAIKARKGHLWGVCATHGLFVGKINENLSSIDRIIVTDTIRASGLEKQILSKIHTISTTKMFAQAIRRTHEGGGSISDLLR